jgi:hypothetical protein
MKYPIVKKLSLFIFIFLIFGYDPYDDFLRSFRRSIGLDRDITDILYITLIIVFCYLSFRKQKDKKIDKILLKMETKLQKPYQFIKLHFIKICLFIIAISLLKIAFFNDDVQKITNAIRGIDMICY